VTVAACGPQAGVVPKSGIYHFEVAMIENTCDPLFDDDAEGELPVEVVDDRITVIMTQVLSYQVPICEGCVPLASEREWETRLDPEDGRYFGEPELFADPTGCRRERVEVEVLDEHTLQARLTTAVARDEACPPIMRPQGPDTLTIDCVVAREYTYSLVEG